MEQFNLWQSYRFGFMALCAWREARNQKDAAIAGVCWAIQNRADNPGWWGHDIPSVVLKAKQFSSFNQGDPNWQKFPDENNPTDKNVFEIASLVFTHGIVDPTEGATHYHDTSICPPAWTEGATRICQIGDFIFYKNVK
jgi:N-acetylmuramoyl-L-alanine amidase